MATRQKRGFRTPRCVACRMPERLCLCALVPRVDNRVPVVVVAHPQELQKPTNTGRFVPRCLARGALVLRTETPAPPAGAALLFPSDDARPLDPERAPSALYVPDGTYRQARRIAGRDPLLSELPRVSLPAGVRAVGYMRHGARPEQLSTLEAVARALGILEGRALEAPLLAFVEVMVKRTLWARGLLSAAEVPGGIPPRPAETADALRFT